MGLDSRPHPSTCNLFTLFRTQPTLIVPVIVLLLNFTYLTLCFPLWKGFASAIAPAPVLLCCAHLFYFQLLYLFLHLVFCFIPIYCWVPHFYIPLLCFTKARNAEGAQRRRRAVPKARSAEGERREQQLSFGQPCHDRGRSKGWRARRDGRWGCT